MPRYSAAGTTGAGSTTLPIIGLYSSATVNGSIVEIGVFNTTAVAVSFEVRRVSTAGTWTALTEQQHEAISAAAGCTAVITASGTAAIGSGIILTFGDKGLSTGLAATTAGVVVIPTGTGQVCNAWITWDE
jgi:hypothetical protein